MKKLLTLLMLLCMVCTGAWAEEIRPTYVSSNTSKGASDSEHASKLVDATGQTTKWGESFTNGTSRLWIIVRAANTILKSYTLTNGNDTHSWPGRRWASWTVEGSNSYDPNGTWTTIDTQTDAEVNYSTQYASTTFSTSSNNTAYSYYKITLTKINGTGSNANMQQMGDLKFEVTQLANLWTKPEYGGTVWTWNTETSKFDATGQTSTATPGRSNSKGAVVVFNGVGTVTASSSGNTSDNGGVRVLGNGDNVTTNLNTWAGSIEVEQFATATVEYGHLKATEPANTTTVWVDGTLNFKDNKTQCTIDDGSSGHRWFIGEHGIINSKYTSVSKGSNTWNLQIVVADEPQEQGVTQSRKTLYKKVMTWGSNISSNINGIQVFYKAADGTYTELDASTAVHYDATGITVEYQGLGNDNKVGFTYIYKYNGEEKHRETINDVAPGSDFPSPAAAWAAMPYGLTAPAPAGTVPTTPEVSYDIELSTANYPFQFSDSYETAKWTALRVRPDNNHRYYLKYETTGTNVKAITTKYDENNVDAYSWAFVGNPFDGFKVYNKAVGENMVWSSSANPRVMNNDDKKWLLTTPWSDATGSGYNTLKIFSLIPQDGSTTDRNNVQSNTIKTWSGNDEGSAFWTEPILAKGRKFVARNVGTANRYAYFSTSASAVKNDANRNQNGKQYLILYPHAEGGYYIYNATENRVVGKTQGSNTATPTVDSEHKADAGRYTFTQVTSSSECTSYYSIKCENSTWTDYASTRCYWHINNGVADGKIIPWEVGSSSNTSSEWIIEDEGEATAEEMQAVKDFLGITDVAVVNVVYKYTDDAGQEQTLKTVSNIEVPLSQGVAQVPINLTANESAAFKEVSYTFGEAEPVVIEHGNSIVALSTTTSDLALSKDETNVVTVNLTLHSLPQVGKLYRLIAEENTARYMYKANDNVMHAGCNTTSGQKLEMFYIVPTHNAGEYELVSAANGLGYPELTWQDKSCTLSTERSGHFTFTRATAAQNLSVLVAQAHQSGDKQYLHVNGGEGTNVVVWNNSGGHSRWYMHEVEESELNGETPASIISSLEKAYAQTILNTRGVGYPIAESATYNALKSVVDNESATIAELSAAVNTYKTSSADVQMPVSGKAYKLNFLHNNAARTKRYIKYDTENGLALTTTAADAATILFTEVDATNHKFVLTLSDGNMLTWRGNNETGAYKVDGSTVKGYSIMVANQGDKDDWNLCWFTDQSTNVKDFGTVRMASRRNTSSNSTWIAGDNGGWQQADESAWFGEEGSTSALQFVEVADVTSETEGYKDGAEKYSLYATAKTYKDYIGEGLGKYTYNTDQTSGLMDAVNACTTLEAERNIVNSIALNMPITGKFYRFKSGEKYMSNEAGSDNVRTMISASNTANSIFYLTEQNELVAFADGFGFNYGYCKPLSPELANTFEFSEGTTVGSYNIHSHAGTGDATYSDRDITVSGDKLARGQGAWTVEEVTYFPITIGSTGFATFYTPIDLVVPEAVTPYVCNLNGDNLKIYTCKQTYTSRGVDYTVIPANTAVMLKANQGSHLFSHIADTGVEAYDNNSFFGDVRTKAFATDYTYYSLQRDNAANNGTVGFFIKPSGNFKGFQAFLKTEASQQVQRFNVTFDEDAVVTGFANVLGTENITIPAYDLSGRKVDANTHRGLYIMNGKKVIR